MTQRDATTRINLNVVNLEALTADPVELKNGDIWYNVTVGQVRMYAAGAKYYFSLTAV